jgi:hypothetical protein
MGKEITNKGRRGQKSEKENKRNGKKRGRETDKPTEATN